MRQNAARMAAEGIQATAATTPAASPPTAPYAHHKAKKSPQVDGDGPTAGARKANSAYIVALNSVHITLSE